MRLKMCRQLGLERDDLMIQLSDDADRGRGSELLGAQDGLNLQRPGIEVALSPSGLSADRIFETLSRAASLGVGARPRMARASRSDSESKASNAAG